MTEKAYNPSICESCGEQFGCGAKLDGCWCSDVKLADNTAEILQETFDKCLCPKCLENYSSKPFGKITNAEVSIETLSDAVRTASQTPNQ